MDKDTEPYLLRPTWASQGCSAAFSVSGLCKQASLTVPVGPDLPGLRAQTGATAGTSAKRLLPGWLPQPQRLHPWGAGSHRRSQPSLHKADRHHGKARSSRLVPVGEGVGEKPEKGWEMPWSLMHKHNRPSRALLLIPVKSHALVHWERQPRRLSTQQAAGPGNRSAWYNTHLCLARLHPQLD